MTHHTAAEMMTVAAARELRDGQVVFVGIDLPSRAANLARRLHAPNLVLVYESGTLDSKPDELPLSIGDGILAETALAVVSVPEVFNYWLQPGRIDVGFLSGAQVDRFANLNTTVIGEYTEPEVRLPGSGGAPEISASCREVIIVMRHRRRAFVDQVDFVTSVGYGTGRGDRGLLGLPGAGPVRVITDLGVLEPDAESGELMLTALHPGVTVEEVRAETGWSLEVAADLAATTPPTDRELETLRAMRMVGAGAMTVALHAVSDGPAGAPVLVMSGSLGSTTEMWRPQLPALTAHFRVVRIDLRGHGGSPTTDGTYRMAELADDVCVLLDRLDLDRVDWCGLSLGAMVGMYLASETPERIRRLALCCTSAFFPDPSVWHDRITAVAAHGTAGIATPVVARWFTPAWWAEHPDVVAESEAMVAGTSDEGYSGCCAALAAWDHRDRLPAITAPTLVVAGTDDLATPVEPHARTIASGIPGARLEIVDGAHLATIESADAVNALLVEHFRP